MIPQPAIHLSLTVKGDAMNHLPSLVWALIIAFVAVIAYVVLFH